MTGCFQTETLSKIIPHDEHSIAAILDSPSVYMGGPSHGSLRKAPRILEYLAPEGWITPSGDRNA